MKFPCKTIKMRSAHAILYIIRVAVLPVLQLLHMRASLGEPMKVLPQEGALTATEMPAITMCPDHEFCPPSGVWRKTAHNLLNRQTFPLALNPKANFCPELPCLRCTFNPRNFLSYISPN